MEKIEKHILYEMINNNLNIDISREDNKFLSLEFQQQYNLIKRMRTQNVPIYQTNLETYALMENITIDPSYPTQEASLLDKNLLDTLKLMAFKKENDIKVEGMQTLFEQYKSGDEKAGLEIVKRITHNKTNQVQVTSMADYYDNEAKFFRGVVDKTPLDGLVFWGHGKKNTTQFLALSKILKRIAPTDLVVIGARPSVGKTSFALAIMNALYKNDYKPMFISLEMTNQELMRRMATAKSGITNNKLFSSEGSLTQEQQALYEGSLLEVAKMDKILLVNEPPKSWLEMKSLIIRHIDEIDYVIIDHLHIIATYDGTQSNDLNIMYGNITRDMKEFCRVYKKPIIVLAQLNREVRGAKIETRNPAYVKPNMTDLRASGSIEQDANTIIMLNRKLPNRKGQELELELKQHTDSGNFPITLTVEKNRSGGTGEIEYLFRASTDRWEERNQPKVDIGSTQKEGGYTYGK